MGLAVFSINFDFGGKLLIPLIFSFHVRYCVQLTVVQTTEFFNYNYNFYKS